MSSDDFYKNSISFHKCVAPEINTFVWFELPKSGHFPERFCGANEKGENSRDWHDNTLHTHTKRHTHTQHWNIFNLPDSVLMGCQGNIRSQKFRRKKIMQKKLSIFGSFFLEKLLTVLLLIAEMGAGMQDLLTICRWYPSYFFSSVILKSQALESTGSVPSSPICCSATSASKTSFGIYCLYSHAVCL